MSALGAAASWLPRPGAVQPLENGLSRQDGVSSRPVRAIPCWRRRKNTRLSQEQFLFSLRISFTSLDPFLASLKQGEGFVSFYISFFTAVPGCARLAETPKNTPMIIFKVTNNVKEYIK
jgi:hypothetical protein